MRQTKAEIVLAVKRLGVLAMFPNSAGAQEEIMGVLSRMVGTKEQLDWLVRTMVDQVGRWYGPKELRGVFCSRFKPLDGIEAYCSETPRFTPGDIESENLLQAPSPMLALQAAGRLKEIAGTEAPDSAPIAQLKKPEKSLAPDPEAETRRRKIADEYDQMKAQRVIGAISEGGM